MYDEIADEDYRTARVCKVTFKISFNLHILAIKMI